MWKLFMNGTWYGGKNFGVFPKFPWIDVYKRQHQVLIFGDYTKLIKKIAKVMNFNILEG